MKLVQKAKDKFILELSQRERQMFTAVLKLYPLLNPDYHQITKSTDDKKALESQELLREAMVESHSRYKKSVEEFLDEKNWSSISADVFCVSLTEEKMEWLLQVLNDVKIGSWVKLGKPDTQRGEKISSTVKNVLYIGAMELAGLFQSLLLQASEE